MGNWATIAFDSEGKECKGELALPNGKIEICKNALYITHPVGNIKVKEGKISIQFLEIYAMRQEAQDSIFVVVKDLYGPECKMAGMASYGFMSDLEWLEKKHPEEFKKIPEKYLKYDCGRFSLHPSRTWGFNFYGEQDFYEITMSIPPPTIEDMWCGIKKSTADAFMAWLKSQVHTEYFENITEALSESTS